MNNVELAWPSQFTPSIMIHIMVRTHLLTLATVTIVTKVAISVMQASPLTLKVAGEDIPSLLAGADILSPALLMLTTKVAGVDIPSPVHIHIHNSKVLLTHGDNNIIIKNPRKDSTETATR